VCLLIALSGVLPGSPLLVAANRDERHDRPAETITVLRERGPRILGGRDKLAGGTWLAVNENGLVAGLTNQPSALGRDDTRRSRGELPLAFAAHADAATAVAKVCADLDPADYNPCWLLVGDRTSLFSVGMTGGRHPEVRRLPPGSYVLENVPLDDHSAKAQRIGQLVAAGIIGKTGANGASGVNEANRANGTHGASGIDGSTGMNDAEAALAAVLRDHRPAVGPGEPGAEAPRAGAEAQRAGAESQRTGTEAPRAGAEAQRVRPAELSAACVHTASYGTRSSMIVNVGANGPPRVLVADGPPCQAPFRDATALWAAQGRDPTRSM
jgi:uncharacterized protein with NRDE domain